MAASLVLLALVGGIVGTTWGMIRATHAQRERNLVLEGQAVEPRGRRPTSGPRPL